MFASRLADVTSACSAVFSNLDDRNSHQLRLASDIAAIDTSSGVCMARRCKDLSQLRRREAEVIDHGGVVGVQGTEDAVDAEVHEAVVVLAEMGEDGDRCLEGVSFGFLASHSNCDLRHRRQWERPK